MGFCLARPVSSCNTTRDGQTLRIHGTWSTLGKAGFLFHIPICCPAKATLDLLPANSELEGREAGSRYPASTRAPSDSRQKHIWMLSGHESGLSLVFQEQPVSRTHSFRPVWAPFTDSYHATWQSQFNISAHLHIYQVPDTKQVCCLHIFSVYLAKPTAKQMNKCLFSLRNLPPLVKYMNFCSQAA